MPKMGDGYVEVRPDLDAFASRLRAKLSAVDGDAEGKKVGQKVSQGITNAMVTGIASAVGRRGALYGTLATFAGPLASALSGLSASTVALGSSLAYAGAQGAMLPGLLSAMGQGAGTVKIAFAGLDDVFKQMAETQEVLADKTATAEERLAAMAEQRKVLAGLHPEARQLVKELFGLNNEWQRLSNNIRGRLFDGLSDEVKPLAKTYLPVLNRGLGKTADVLNDAAKSAADWLGKPSVVKDMNTLMAGNARIVGTLSKALGNVVDGMRHVFVALLPNTEDFATSVENIADGFRDWARGARKSGSLTKFMAKAQKSGSILWDIIVNIGAALGATFGAGVKSGNDLLKGIRDLTNRWKLWARGLTGQNQMAEWFDEGREVGHEFWLILRDIGRAFGDLAGTMDSSDAVASLRKNLVQPLLDLLVDLNKSGVGEQLLKSLGDLFDVLNDIGVGNVLVSFLRTLTSILDPIAVLTREIPGLTNVLGLMFAAWGSYKAISLVQGALGSVQGSFTATSSKVRTLTSDLATGRGGLGRFNQMMSGLKDAARQAAGAGGLLLLSKSATETDDTLKTFERTAGGAMLGFSVGGPWGAAIGGGIGLLTGLADSTDTTSQSMKRMAEIAANGRGAQLDLRDALNQTTGAMTRQARVQVSQDIYNQKLGTSLSRLGLESRDLVGAILGQKGAYERVTSAVNRYKNAGGALASLQANQLSDAAVNVGAYLSGANKKFKKTRDEIRAVHEGTTRWGKALKDLPKDVRTRLRNLDYKVSMAQLKNLAKRMDTTPKNLRTKLELAGVKVVEGQSKETKKNLEDVGRAKPKLDGYQKSLKSGIEAGARATSKAVMAMVRSIGNETGKAKANFNPLRLSVVNGTMSIAGEAQTGGRNIGSSLTSGLSEGMVNASAELSAAVRAAVRDAIAAGRAEARAHSPSRETMRLGNDMGDGLTVGMRARGGEAEKAARGLIARMVRALMSTGKALDRFWTDLRKSATKRFEGKREKQALKDIAQLEKSWTRSQKDRIRLTEQLRKAQEKLNTVLRERADYAKQVTDSAKAFASITAGGLAAGSSAEQFFAEQQGRLDALRAYATNIEALRAQGLSEAILRDLVDAGVEGGSAAAQALVEGGASAIAQANALQQQIAAVAGSLGTDAAKDFFQSGVEAAQALVDGIQKELSKAMAKLRKAATNMARLLRKQLNLGGGDGGGKDGKGKGDKGNNRLPSQRPRVGTTARTVGVATGHIGRGVPQPTGDVQEVRVFIGERELTDIVRVEVKDRERQTVRRVRRGAKVVR